MVAQCRLVLSHSVCLICLLVLAASCTVDVPNHSRALFKVSALSVHSKVFGYPNSTFSITLNAVLLALASTMHYCTLHFYITTSSTTQYCNLQFSARVYQLLFRSRNPYVIETVMCACLCSIASYTYSSPAVASFN